MVFFLNIYIYYSLLVIYIYTVFMGDTMYYLYLFIQAVRPISHYAIDIYIFKVISYKVKDLSIQYI